MFCMHYGSTNSFKNFAKTTILDFPDAEKSSFGRVRKACLRVVGYLEQSCCVLGAPGMHLGGSELCLGRVLGRSWCVLGGSWKGFGTSWRLPGGFLGIFLEVFLTSWAICENSKKPRKNNGFSLIFKVLGGPWASESSKKPMKRHQERLRETKIESQRGLGRRKKRKMSQHEAPRLPKVSPRGLRDH